ncbi:MAG: hypothetical protein ABIH99_04210 [Candidatus Micrarchaeota archaeon]
MPNFKLGTSFYPIRLSAYMKSEAELTISIENMGSDVCWVECDVLVPESISLAPDRPLSQGRIRVGIVQPKETRTGRCKIYSGLKSYPGLYTLKLIALGYGKDGSISGKLEKAVDLRCATLTQ